MPLRYIYRAYRARYFRQAGEIRAVTRALQRGDLAVDVGAHKGRFVYWMRRSVGAEGRVVAFEPQPRLAAYLQEVTRALGWRNVQVRPCAVSDRAGSALLRVPGTRGVSAGASLDSAAYAVSAVTSYECPTVTLDEELGAAGRVALIKVDVEGHELSVFRGAEKILSRDGPALLFECEGRHLTAHGPADVFRYLEALGYEGAFLAPVALRPLSEFDPAVHQRAVDGRPAPKGPYCNNFLFTRPR